MNVASALGSAARERPDAAALVLPSGRRVRYRDLDADADAVARGLASFGVGKGTRVALLVPPGADFFPLVFGLFRAGAVPVVVDPGMGLRRMRTCLAEAAPEAFVGSRRAHLARLLLGLGGDSVRIRVGVGRCLGFCGTSMASVRKAGARAAGAFPEVGPDDPAAILFTSGSTGPPRGAVYTHGNFAAQVESVRRTFGIGEGEVDLPTFPLFALFDPALGMTTVVPEMDFARPARADPAGIARAVLEHGVTTMFASPGLLDPLSAWCAAKGVTFPSLRRVVSAGAPVSPRVVERMARALPEGAILHTPYGATEALPVASIDHREILGGTAARTAEGAGVCVGRPVEGVEVRCIRVEDGPIAAWSADLEVPPGTPGEVCVRGPQVTRGYWGRPDADALAKIPDPAGGSWHRMGDVGTLDGAGRLWFLGRKSQRVRTAEGDLYPDQVEGIFNGRAAVHRSALVGVGEPGRQVPFLWAELECEADLGLWTSPAGALREEFGLGPEAPEPSDPSARDLRARLRRQVEANPGFFLPLHGEALPVDSRHNAKIQREALAARAARKPKGNLP